MEQNETLQAKTIQIKTGLKMKVRLCQYEKDYYFQSADDSCPASAAVCHGFLWLQTAGRKYWQPIEEMYEDKNGVISA